MAHLQIWFRFRAFNTFVNLDSAGMGLETYQYSRKVLKTTYQIAVDIKWLGLKSSDLLILPQHSYVPLNSTHIKRLQELAESPLIKVKSLTNLLSS